jgi:DNA-binding PadR family transcriptional regulator
LHHSTSHGYTLLERLEEFGLGTVDSGVVYRALRDMEQMGWVTSAWDAEQAQGPPRRVYRLTAQGDQVLGDWVRDLRQTRRQIDHLVETYDRHMEEGDGEHH